MANPQKENGYTGVSNELLEQVYKLRLNGTQFKIIMVLWRFTYGFSRREYKLSVSFISKAIQTDIRTVKRELNKLIEIKLINVISEASFNSTRIISFNKDYDTWLQDNHQVGNKPLDDEIPTKSGGEMPPNSGGELDTQDKQVFKENLKQVSTPKKPNKHKYGEFRNVLLTDQEKERLISELGHDTFERCIKKLDEYIETTGRKYKNHNLVIHKWVINSVKEDEKKEGANRTYGEKYDTGDCNSTDYYKQFITS